MRRIRFFIIYSCLTYLYLIPSKTIFACDFASEMLTLNTMFPKSEPETRRVAVHEYLGMLGYRPRESDPKPPDNYFSILRSGFPSPSAAQMIQSLLVHNKKSLSTIELMTSLTKTSHLIVVTLQNSQLESATRKYLDKNDGALVLTLGSSEHPIPKSLQDFNGTTVHSLGGLLNLPAGATLPPKVTFIGGFCSGCQPFSIKSVINRFLNTANQKEISLVVERNLSYDLKRSNSTLDSIAELYFANVLDARFEKDPSSPNAFIYHGRNQKIIRLKFEGDDWHYLH